MTSENNQPATPDDPFGDFFVTATASRKLLAALKRIYCNVEEWYITGVPADATESREISKQMRDAIIAADPNFVDSGICEKDPDEFMDVAEYGKVSVVDADDVIIPGVKICNTKTGFVIREELVDGEKIELREMRAAPLSFLVRAN